MPNVQITLHFDDRGSVKVKQFTDTVERESRRAAQAAQSNFRRMSTATNRHVDQMTNRLLKWGGLMTVVFGGLATRSVVRFGTEFQRRMSGVRAVTLENEKTFGDLEAQARKLGATTIFTATQAGESMEELGKAGFDTLEIYRQMPAVLNLAAAGELEMAEAAKIASDALRIMELDAGAMERVGDVITKTATSSKTTVSELGFAFQDALPVARALGLEIEDVSGHLGILANRGFTATRAGTALRRIYSVFLGNLEDGEKGIERFNLQLRDNTGNFLGMAHALEELNREGVDFADIMDSFGLRGGPAMLNIFRAGSEAVDDWRTALDEAGGTMDSVARQRMENLWGKTKELASALQEVGLVIFDKVGPRLEDLAIDATEVARSWGALLKRSDVFGGISRLMKIGATVAGLYGIAIGYGLARKMIATADAAIRLSIGVDATNASTLRGISHMTRLGDLTTAQKAGFLGLAGAVGTFAYQLGRAISETTGLDAVMSDFFDSMINRKTNFDTAFQTVADDIYLAGRNLEALEDMGVEVPIEADLSGLFENLDAFRDRAGFVQEETERIFEELRAAGDTDSDYFVTGRAVTQAQANLKALEDQAGQYKQEIRDLFLGLTELRQEMIAGGAEARESFAAAWKAAGEEGISTLDRLRAAFSLYEKDRDAGVQAEIQRLEQEEAARKALRDSAERLAEVLKGTSIATSQMGEALAEEVNEALGDAANLGIDATRILDLFESEVRDMSLAIQEAGQEAPESLQAIIDKMVELWDLRNQYAQPVEGESSLSPDDFLPDEEAWEEATIRVVDFKAAAGEPPEYSAWGDFWETLRGDAGDTVDSIGKAWGNLVNQAIGSFSTMLGQVFTGQAKLGEAFAQTMKSLASQAISMLVQWGIQRLILGKLVGVTTAGENAAKLGGALASVYANTYASIAAIPIVGPAMAPGWAAAALATASAGSATAGGVGAGIGAGIGILGAAQEGALITRETILRGGEMNHPEAVIPLQGAAARKVAAALGLGQGGDVVNVNATFGDVLTESVPSRLAEMVAERLADLIQAGRVEPLPVETRP